MPTRVRIILMKSPRAEKKFRVIWPDGRHVDFGATGYEDYTIHKDPTRKEKYIIRHQKREDWTNPRTAGFWSRWILWNLPSFKRSVKDTEKRFNLRITLAKR
jgi:hypothetical protein